MSTLYIVATPIGNLEDISLRALRVLKEVDLILCEDTRVTKKLLDHFHIEKPLINYHQHSKLQKMKMILEFVKAGKTLALVCDAGTPGISDPGNNLIAFLVEHFPKTSLYLRSPETSTKFSIVPVPGPSALTSIASIAGFPMDKFMFLGFPPAKKGRKKFFAKVLAAPYPVILYESPYRIIETLRELQALCTLHDLSHTQIIVGRELTKKFEMVYRGKIAQVLEQLEKEMPRGECTLVVFPRKDFS